MEKLKFVRSVVCGVLSSGAVMASGAVRVAEPEPSGSNEVMRIFRNICQVPRYSSHERHMGNWLMDWANTHGFAATRDEVGGSGNVIIEVPATPGMDTRELVVLQTHQDMVCAVKEGVTHDWDKDPIVPVVEDGWIRSKDGETSLGADDGIGMAIVLAIAEGKVPHGPLRLVMTVEEETTQNGALQLSQKTVSDAKYLINVDSEQEGEVVVSSACADMSTFTLTPGFDTPCEEGKAFAVALSGLHGGHSGIDINRGRSNAIVALGQMLHDLAESVEFQLASFEGGIAGNAIPTFATAVIVLKSDADVEAVRAAASALQSRIAVGEDAGATVSVNDRDRPENVLSPQVQNKLLALVKELPNGVLKMTEDLPDLVQTSSNLGIIDVTASGIRIVSAMRSSSEEDYKALLSVFEAKAKELGFSWTHEKNCEIWPVDTESDLLEICKDTYTDVFKTDIKVIAVHAGLECGAFKIKNPKLDMIAVGPTVVEPHTVNEKCDLESCGRVFDLVRGILARIPEIRGSSGNPWAGGDSVTVWTNGTTLVIGGTGAMSNFVSAADVPWAVVAGGLTGVEIENGVTRIGVNALAGFAANVPVCGLTATVLNDSIPAPAGAISGAEFGTVEIVDGKAYLGVSVYTNGDVTATTEGWGAAQLDPETVEQAEDGRGLVIPVPATAEKGFMILKSKPAGND